MDIRAQQKRYRAELQAMARTDELTGLYNRAGLVGARERMTAEGPRHAAVLMADLDHLKQINDRFGHHEGDAALRTAADILRKALGAEPIIGRLGGDEFQACFSRPTEAALRACVERVKDACAAHNASAEAPYYVELSLGYALGVVENRESWEALASRADAALYEAKKARRPSVLK